MTATTLKLALRRWLQDRDRWLLGGAALALAISFLHPGFATQRVRFEHVVVLDVTQSMNVADEQIDGQPVARLAYAKQLLREVLLRLPCGSKVGWAVFTEYRSYLLFTPVEVCANLSELRATLALIDGRMAWSGNSEIAKGLHSGLALAKQLPSAPAIVFVTDGQEAPPLNPRRRPPFDDKPGDAQGLLVGVGGVTPLPIPKVDPQGQPLGFWRADEVAQTDPRIARGVEPDPAGATALGATPGSEHLSSLREGYLRLLAREQGLGFVHPSSAVQLAAAMTAPAFARPVPVRADARLALAGLALALLLARAVAPLWQRLRRRRGAALGRYFG